MTETPEVPNKGVMFWTVTWASADRSDISGATTVYWTEAEAYAAIRQELKNEAENLYEGEGDLYEARIREIDAIPDSELDGAYAELGDDWIQGCWKQQHTLLPPEGLRDIGSIEAFLEDK